MWLGVMPCTAKNLKYERNWKWTASGTWMFHHYQELAQMIKEARIDFLRLEDEHFDEYYGESTGAAVIFGATGG